VTIFQNISRCEAAERLAESNSAFERRFEREQALVERVADVTARESVFQSTVEDGDQRR
jgi:hypothetical protein